MPDFSALERTIQRLFPEGSLLNHNYKVIICGKPTCSNGEPKTDIYLLLQDINTKAHYEAKISIKKDNAEFLENKTSAERAEAIFGSDWKDIIIKSTTQLDHQFNKRPLIYKSSYRRTEKGAITLGWKFEILNVQSGELSAPIALTKSQKLDIYSGSNLSDDKKNAFVKGTCIQNCGVANFLLDDIDLDTFSSGEEVLNKMIPIDKYIDTKNPQLYFACKALNYRSFIKKFDGDRPLSVFVNWSAINGRLTPQIVFDKPLTTRGNSVYKNLFTALYTLNIKNTDDINSSNVSCMHFVYE